jgi:hypothetical protein
LKTQKTLIDLTGIMNKTTAQGSDVNGMAIVKAYTFRKMVSMLDSLTSLDFRGNGIQVCIDSETFSADLHMILSPYRKSTLTFQVTEENILVLGDGKTDMIKNLNVPEISKILERFVSDKNGMVH